MEGLSACECPVCFLLLNHTTHEPMSMPCGHTLCKVCVEELGGRSTNTVSRGGHQTRPAFQCPICRQWVNSDAVSLNVTLRDLLTELHQLDKKRGLSMRTTLDVSYSEVKVEEVLDRGAFGEVCRGRWRGNDVALKLFSTGRPTPETMEAFQREVFVMNCLVHPNVVLLLGACQTPPKLAIIMEFVAGGSLHQMIHVEKRALSVEEVASLATDICRGLQYLHSINILHRDMKSKNVLLTGAMPCHAKLCDFGLSRMRLESATMTGNVGTVHWTAPEVLNSERYRFSADVYGFGMVLYEMVTGSIPLGHMVPMAVMLAVAVRRVRPTIPIDAHPTFKQLLDGCSMWVPGERPSLLFILSSLSPLLPHTPSRGMSKKGVESGQKGKLEHQDSLGVIFLSATDSADLKNQDSSLSLLVRHNQNKIVDNQKTSVNRMYAPPTPPPPPPPPPAPPLLPPSDAREVQIEADRELAEQLQLKENSFQLSQAKSSTHSIFPPQSLLNSIKTKLPILKPVQTTPTEEPLMTKQSRHRSKRKSAKTKTGTNNPPPPPPPPPPPVHQRAVSSRRILLRDLKAHATTVARRLRPVQTVEKRAFRVGHVVGGDSNERRHYTMQNLIRSFPKRLLRPVTIEEPQTAYPVGRVVQSRVKVKRMSSTFEQSPSNNIPNPPPFPNPSSSSSSVRRRRLHPSIREAVERFSKKDLHHVQTTVRQKLPSRQELEKEKRSKVMEEVAEFDRDLLVKVVTVVRNTLPSSDVLEKERYEATRTLVLQSVVTFNHDELHQVVTVVKNQLPSNDTIELERQQQQQQQQ